MEGSLSQWPAWKVPPSLVSFASASFMPGPYPGTMSKGSGRAVSLGSGPQFPQLPCLFSGGLAYLPVDSSVHPTPVQDHVEPHLVLPHDTVGVLCPGPVHSGVLSSEEEGWISVGQAQQQGPRAWELSWAGLLSPSLP